MTELNELQFSIEDDLQDLETEIEKIKMYQERLREEVEEQED